MKIECHRSSLISALQIVGGVIPSRTSRDILKNVHLIAGGDSATLVGTNEQVGIRYEIPGVEVESAGDTLLPAGRMVSILREMTDDSVGIDLEQDVAWITCGRSEFQIPVQHPAEFPPVPGFAEGAHLIVDGAAFAQGIRRTVFATDTDSTRYALGGVLIERDGDQLTLAATDSRRLAVASLPCSGMGSPSKRSTVVIPKDAMSLVERSVDEGEDVRIAIHDNDALIRTAQSTIYCRLLDGRFPRYRDVIPAAPSSSIDLVARPFYSAVRQAQIVTSAESRGVDIKFADGRMTFSSETADVGRSVIYLPVSYDAKPMTVTYDARLLADALRVLNPEQPVQLQLTDPDSASVLRVEDSYLYVIMPLSR